MADLQSSDARTTILARIPKRLRQHEIKLCISPNGKQILFYDGKKVRLLQESKVTEIPYLFDRMQFLYKEFKNCLLVKFKNEGIVYIALYNLSTGTILAKMNAGINPIFSISNENYICLTNDSMTVSRVTIKECRGKFRFIQSKLFKRTHPCYDLTSSSAGEVILITDCQENFTFARANGKSWQMSTVMMKISRMTFYSSDPNKFAALHNNEISLMELSPERHDIIQRSLFQFFFIDFDIKDNLCAINFSYGELSSCVIDITTRKFICKQYKNDKSNIILHPTDRELIFLLDDSNNFECVIKQTTLQSKWSWANMKKVNPLFLQKVFTLCVIYKLLPLTLSTRKRKRSDTPRKIPFLPSEIWELVIEILFLHEVLPLR